MTRPPSVVVLDYGSGNIHSAIKALEHAGASVTLSAERRTIAEADGLVVPGVGAFGAVMGALTAVNGPEMIGRRISGARPVLGICVGMQVLFDQSVEGGTAYAGLGEWPGTVVRLNAGTVPHMGWNTVEADSDSVLFKGVADERFYFVHSYAVTKWELEVNPPFPKPRLAWAQHGDRFLAAVENGPLTATQFHPEKSGEAGIRLLSNWVKSL